ncbi:type IV pilus biogenesis protein PilM [Pectobacteriaceae bacterium CE70]|nr:type IV pilus biogenesis protein PilM [Pectobacteriaceae bacterium C52]WJV67851.1 type IV pilus biogenesis protein PilM [Pectobacteriaceae bacterium CE70]WJY11794.1 type IV pilus biogenesis protein PilM [Pectobacteriaceae bacterium C80]
MPDICQRSSRPSLMGYGIAALSLIFLLIVGNVQTRDASRLVHQNIQVNANLLAADILRLASAVNDWRYTHQLAEGPLVTGQFGMLPATDSRIQAAIQGGRLWLWSVDRPGLVDSLHRQSAGSALVCTVSGGRLKMSDGTDMNLLLPAGVAEGNVVYLN